jgi:alanine dehydrogenase
MAAPRRPKRTPLYVPERRIKPLFDEKTSFRLAHEAFRLMGDGKTLMPPKIYLVLPGEVYRDFRAMPAFVKGGGGEVCGIKWVSVYPQNPKKRLPTVGATILLNDSSTSELLAVMEANEITAVRTAAAAAVASRYLAVKNPRILSIVGAGFQAGYQLRSHLSLYRFDQIRVWGYAPGEAQRFCERFSKISSRFIPCSSVESCVNDADIVITCTPSRKPIVRRSWIKKGAHINAIGADAKGKQELDPMILKSSRLVVDEWEQASHSGEINVPVSMGLIRRGNVHAELAQIVAGQKPGRRRASEITVFDSTGLAILDIYFAKYVFSRLKK